MNSRTSLQAGAHIVTVLLHVKSEHVQDFKREVSSNAAASLRNEKGCRQFDVCFSSRDSGEVFLYEVYDSEAAFDAHLASAHFAQFSAISASWIVDKIVSVFERPSAAM